MLEEVALPAYAQVSRRKTLPGADDLLTRALNVWKRKERVQMIRGISNIICTYQSPISCRWRALLKRRSAMFGWQSWFSPRGRQQIVMK